MMREFRRESARARAEGGRVKMSRLFRFALCWTALGFAPSVARADAVSDFFAGKVINLVIASGEGGYDLYGRLVSRHLGKHIPGNPRIVAQTMPGAGGLQGANHVYNIAPRDGATIGLIRRNAIIAHITNPSGVRFDIAKMNWLGNLIPEMPVAIAWHDAKAKTFDELRRSELIVGGTGPASVHETSARLFNALLGTKYRIVGGYKGSGDLDLAMERGETQGIAYDSWSGVKLRKGDWIRRGLIHVTLSYGLDRNPDLPDAPFALDHARDDDDKRLMQLYFAQDAVARPMIAPPGVPADRLAALRAAFMALGADPEFLADAEKSMLQIGLSDAASVKKIVDMVAGTPHALAQRLATLTAP